VVAAEAVVAVVAAVAAVAEPVEGAAGIVRAGKAEPEVTEANSPAGTCPVQALAVRIPLPAAVDPPAWVPEETVAEAAGTETVDVVKEGETVRVVGAAAGVAAEDSAGDGAGAAEDAGAAWRPWRSSRWWWS
jgi:hypothetical protein